MFEKNYYTLREIEELYGVKVNTLTSYIARGVVIPDEVKGKIGGIWAISKEWVDMKYGHKKDNE